MYLVTDCGIFMLITITVQSSHFGDYKTFVYFKRTFNGDKYQHNPKKATFPLFFIFWRAAGHCGQV